ncbi:hypothetical protein [Thermosyntropha sp.]|uniref:hypothetical protein n=1 Tax=Thermosyntropha sp. TaxID=2740820 RepID=UPI0025FBC562|nr:hypothetical protein [Thermosyntropha sp.]MBO8159209.1 hypothetical protein [Thermosyntropha sp.]
MMLWLKSAGVILVILSSGIWGLMGARNLQLRVEQLKDLRMALNFLEKEIAYMHTPLSSALRKTGYFCASPIRWLFLESAERLERKEGRTAYEAWLSGVYKLERASSLKTEDIELLKTGAMQIGISDVYEQRKFFSMLQEELKIMEEKAEKEAESGVKLWSYGGFILGAVIVLLFI